MSTQTAETKKRGLKILLLTNRDSDNVGDQIIEATDISLINTAMHNLGYSDADFSIISRAASIVPKVYMDTKDPKYLETAHRVIQKCDLVLFGGAPLFNYAYQPFYERTATTIEIAAKYGKPVFFSGIGVEGYDEDNEKCQRLKKALNMGNVKQITTRDGFENLANYCENDNFSIGKVSDPAVFTKEIFRKRSATTKKPSLSFRIKRKIRKMVAPEIASEAPQAKPKSKRKRKKGSKTIGIFVLRANGFKDNGVDFSREDAAHLWLDIINELENRGYDYELLTSGHFGDEAFLDSMIREFKVPSSHCIFNVNSPEDLVRQIKGYSGVISTRLHPNIVSFSLQVPTVGIIWNTKVSHFYDGIGYPNRYLRVDDDISAKKVVDRLEAAMGEGVERDPEYMITVYQTMMEGLRKCLCPTNPAVPYTYEQLTQELVPFQGTDAWESQRKLERKFRRTYSKYNELWMECHGPKALARKQEEEAKKKVVPGRTNVYFYTLPKEDETITYDNSVVQGDLITHESGSLELKNTGYFSDEPATFPECCFESDQRAFKGWTVRIGLGKRWLWYMKDGSMALKGQVDDAAFFDKKALYAPGDDMPLMKMKEVKAVIAEAVWE